jgi:hypothetical protein
MRRSTSGEVGCLSSSPGGFDSRTSYLDRWRGTQNGKAAGFRNRRVWVRLPPALLFDGSVAQWQSGALLKRGSWVRLPPFPLDGLVAQLAESPALTRQVVGSIPTGATGSMIDKGVLLGEQLASKTGAEGSTPSILAECCPDGETDITRLSEGRGPGSTPGRGTDSVNGPVFQREDAGSANRAVRVQIPVGPLKVGRVGTSAGPLVLKTSAAEKVAAGSTPAPSAGEVGTLASPLASKASAASKVAAGSTPALSASPLSERQGHPRSVPVRTRLCEGCRSGSIPDEDTGWCFVVGM